jgi:hypothetical protein
MARCWGGLQLKLDMQSIRVRWQKAVTLGPLFPYCKRPMTKEQRSFLQLSLMVHVQMEGAPACDCDCDCDGVRHVIDAGQRLELRL